MTDPWTIIISALVGAVASLLGVVVDRVLAYRLSRKNVIREALRQAVKDDISPIREYVSLKLEIISHGLLLRIKTESNPSDLSEAHILEGRLRKLWIAYPAMGYIASFPENIRDAFRDFNKSADELVPMVLDLSEAEVAPQSLVDKVEETRDLAGALIKKLREYQAGL